MMLALGMFVFMRQTLPHQTMQRDAEYLWPSNSRVGKRDSFQYLGPVFFVLTINTPQAETGILSLGEPCMN